MFSNNISVLVLMPFQDLYTTSFVIYLVVEYNLLA